METREVVLVFVGLIVGIALTVGIIAGCLVYMPPELELINDLDAIIVGEEAEISMLCFGIPQLKGNFYYASEDPEIATVDDNGVILARKQGSTVIYVQSKSNFRQRLLFEIKTVYETKFETKENVSILNEKIKVDKSASYWQKNKYVERTKENIFDVAEIVTKKSKDQYIFSDIFLNINAQGYDFYSFDDWGNEDVVLNGNNIANIDAVAFIRSLLGVEEEYIDQIEAELVFANLCSQIKKEILKYQGIIRLSELSNDCEYRVSVKIDFRVLRIVNYYCKGIESGLDSIINGLSSMDLGVFLDSYTYQKPIYEFVLDGVDIVIEQRTKMQ